MNTDWHTGFSPSTAERPVVAVIGTMDTKGEEFSLVCELISKFDCAPLVIDSGVLGEPRGIQPHIGRAAVAMAAGYELDKVRQMGRGPAVEAMAEGVTAVVTHLQREGLIGGVLSMGGAEGTVLGCAAMRALPVGFPKVMVSAIASGRREFGDFTGTSDIAITNSVVDVAGFNSIIELIYRNATASVCGMARAAAGDRRDKAQAWRPVVAITILGNTQQAFDQLRLMLDESYEVIPFHANGTGGPTMERLVEEGFIDLVIDLTTNEVSNELRDGVMASQSKTRLQVAGPKGVPQVVVPGCVDFFQAGPIGQLRPEWRSRPIYRHNPHFTLVRATAEEMATAGVEFANRLNQSIGPLVIVWPTKGLSLADIEGGEFWDPVADQRFLDELRTNLTVPHELVLVDAHINDMETAKVIVRAVHSFSPGRSTTSVLESRKVN